MWYNLSMSLYKLILTGLIYPKLKKVFEVSQQGERRRLNTASLRFTVFHLFELKGKQKNVKEDGHGQVNVIWVLLLVIF